MPTRVGPIVLIVRTLISLSKLISLMLFSGKTFFSSCNIPVATKIKSNLVSSGKLSVACLIDSSSSMSIKICLTLSSCSVFSARENLKTASTDSSASKVSTTAFPIAPREPITATVFFINYGFLISSII